MEVKNAKVVTLRVGDNELGDAMGAHNVQSTDSKFVVADTFGVAGHDIGSRQAVEGGIGFNHAAEVAVGDNTLNEEFPVRRFYDDSTAEATGGHLEDGLTHRGCGGNLWFLVLHVEVGHTHIELFAQGTAGMESREIGGGEMTTGHESRGQGIAHDELCSGAAGGSEVVRTGFVLDGGVEHYVGFACEERVGVANNGNKFVTEILYQRDKNLDFGGIAALREAKDNIAGLNHAEVAMDGIGGMHEQSRSARAVEGRNYFCGNVGTLTNSGNYHAARGVKNGFYSL